MSVVHIRFSFDPIAVKTEEKLYSRISFCFWRTCHNEHYRDSFRTWKFFRHEQRNCVSCSQLEAKLTFSLCYIAHHLILTYTRILREAALSKLCNTDFWSVNYGEPGLWCEYIFECNIHQWDKPFDSKFHYNALPISLIVLQFFVFQFRDSH